MEQLKDVRALRRGLAVLEALTRGGPASLSGVARDTGLPKSTARRILATLEDTGFIRKTLGDGLYRSNLAEAGGDAGRSHRQASAPIAAAAKPVLEALSREVVWPSDLFVRDGTALQIVETTRTLSPLLVNRQQIGDRVDMLTTAVGRAYLAWCPQSERTEILETLTRQRNRPAMDGLAETLEEVRANGFAVRDPRCTGASALNPFLIDRLYAVAVPVMAGERVACCLNLLWPISAAASVGDERKMAALLREKAAEISANLKRANERAIPIAAAARGKHRQASAARLPG